MTPPWPSVFRSRFRWLALRIGARWYRPLVPSVFQVLIVVDVEGVSVEEELLATLPDQRRDRLVLRLTDHGAPKVERHGPAPQPIDWMRIGRAIEVVADKAIEAAKAASGDTLHLYVGGTGPLPVFIHLGYAIKKFTGPQWVIGRRPGAAWEALPLADSNGASSLLTSSPLPDRASHATGQVAVYLDVAARPMNVEALRDAVELGGERLADATELRPGEGITVTAENAGALASEVTGKLAVLPALFPHASSLGMFVAGPTMFAFAAGRALNPTIVRSARLYNYSTGKYELVYDLPFDDQSRAPLPADEGSLAARGAVRDVILRALEELRVEVTAEDLGGLLQDEERQQFLSRLAALTYRDSETNEFSLSIAGGSFSIDDGLLEALRSAEPGIQERFAKQLLLHELFHDHQGIRSTNYFEVGRAGVVLEAVDFAADVFALRVLLAGALRRHGAPTTDEVRRITGEWFAAVLFGVQAFDRLEHGARIKRLADRRLRRYLTWHLQAVRGEFVDTPADVQSLLASPVTAEVAPVTARVDHRFDREVLVATPRTEFFASVGGRLIRHNQRPGFDPGSLLEAVRGFNVQGIQQAMRFVVEENRAVLVPWRR